MAKYVVANRDAVITSYREYITTGDGRHLIADLHELKNKTLGCFCHPKPCHGDVLLELIERYCNHDR